MRCPSGVRAIAVLFFLVTSYLCIIGLVMLVSPGTVSMTFGTPLLSGLEIAGPYMFLLMGGVAALIGWGLLRLNNWARRTAILVAMIGIVLLVPSVSAAAVGIHTATLIWGGLGIVARMGVVWYLYQTPTAEQFS